MVPGIPSEQCWKVGQICPKMQVNTCKMHALYRVRIGPGKPGKSWNFILVFSRTVSNNTKSLKHTGFLIICDDLRTLC